MLESRRPAAENVDLLGKVVPLGRIELVLQVSLRGPRKAGDKIEEGRLGYKDRRANVLGSIEQHTPVRVGYFYCRTGLWWEQRSEEPGVRESWFPFR